MLLRVVEERKQETRWTTETIQCQEIVRIRISDTCCMEGLVEEAEWDITEVTGAQSVKEDMEVTMGGTLGMQGEARVAGLG